MPNWCMNTIEITDPATKLEGPEPNGLDQIREKLRTFDNKSLIFAGLIGTNAEKAKKVEHLESLEGLESEKTIEKTETGEAATLKSPSWICDTLLPDWYQHNVSRYGTKWDVPFGDCDFTYDEEKKIIGLVFDTAWSPPTNFCKTLQEIFHVNVKCRFFEPGCDFAGEHIYHADGISDTQDYSYLEGMYLLDESYFWDEFKNAIDTELDEADDAGGMPSTEDVLAKFLENYSFLSNKDLARARQIWRNKRRMRLR